MISIFDLFSIGLGPSSSHTVGPMRAAYECLTGLRERGFLQKIERIQIDLYGSLALTGKGHGSDKAIIMGLSGEMPETIDPDKVEGALQQLTDTKKLKLLNEHQITFDPVHDIIFNSYITMEKHSNAMKITAFNKENQTLEEDIYYSIGGGFIIKEGEEVKVNSKPPYPFSSTKELRALCDKNQMSIAELVMANEKTWRSEGEIKQQLLNIANIMEQSIVRGCTTEKTILPGVLQLRRRAPILYQKLDAQDYPLQKPTDIMQWLNLFAIAVAEENAAAGRVVTAPTNGASGIIPAILQYSKKFTKYSKEKDILTFLLTAGAIGILYKSQASISGAEVGCQGEVGVACSMAAGALAAIHTRDFDTIEKAAEIGMEHNLGLTCDPVAGLVQIPCIERNAMGAVKAVNAAIMAVAEGGSHRVSLDEVIATMMEIGKNMSSKYRETALGGLASHVPIC
ncbi:MAG: L-serine ammonia-lyase [Gammaproteobacteria bacterium]|nr:L-serine ammonia-lyase [Gammaproteobacteria bacterium]